MFYEKRVYNVSEVADEAEAAQKLTAYSWTLCTAFRVGNLLLVNDASSEDGAQEYAVIKDGYSIESLTVSWMEQAKLERYLRELQTVEIGSESFHCKTKVRTNHKAVRYCTYCA